MASDGAARGECHRTGLAVPECSCSSCLEEMLREFSPHLLAGEITITRMSSGGGAATGRDALEHGEAGDREEPGGRDESRRAA